MGEAGELGEYFAPGAEGGYGAFFAECRVGWGLCD